MNELEHDEQTQRYILHLNGNDYAYITYRIEGNHIILTYSYVPPSYRGMGIGQKLVKDTLVEVEKLGYSISATCGYIYTVAKRDPYWKDKMN